MWGLVMKRLCKYVRERVCEREREREREREGRGREKEE